MAIKYITDDGQEFTNERDALKHEEKMTRTKEIQSLIEAAKRISEICDTVDDYESCKIECPFYSKVKNQCIFNDISNTKTNPCDWELD